MTTIAYRDGILAADTQVTLGNHIKGVGRKITELQPGLVIAVAGDSRDEAKFKRWILAGADPDNPPEFAKKEFEAFVIKNKEVFICERHPILMPLEQTFYAIGSGWELAIAAMQFGRSAKEAVEFASTLDIHTSLPVDTYDIKKAGKVVKGRKAGT